MEKGKIKVEESEHGDFQVFVNSRDVHYSDMRQLNYIIDELKDEHYELIASALINNKGAYTFGIANDKRHFMEGLMGRNTDSMKLIFYKGSMAVCRDWPVSDIYHRYQIFSEIRTEFTE